MTQETNMWFWIASWISSELYVWYKETWLYFYWNELFKAKFILMWPYSFITKIYSTLHSSIFSRKRWTQLSTEVQFPWIDSDQLLSEVSCKNIDSSHLIITHAENSSSLINSWISNSYTCLCPLMLFSPSPNYFSYYFVSPIKKKY